jgi:ethylbenzene dioxygenase beta subunit
MDRELVHDVEQFLYREARLLDQRQYDEWLQLFTDDIRYWMPVVSTRERGGPEVAGDRELAFFDDNKLTLGLRVKRLYTEFAFAEDPPSRTARVISNVEVAAGASANETKVYCTFVVYKTRLERELDLFAGHREDVLRKIDGDWKIAWRKIVLAQSVVASKNLSIFF